MNTFRFSDFFTFDAKSSESTAIHVFDLDVHHNSVFRSLNSGHVGSKFSKHEMV